MHWIVTLVCKHNGKKGILHHINSIADDRQRAKKSRASKENSCFFNDQAEWCEVANVQQQKME